MSTSVKGLVKEINSSLASVSSSTKDEEKVMRAMLNDKDYKVDVYGKEGKIGEYCPAQDARDMVTGIIAATTKISKDEAAQLADSYDFKRSDSEAMIRLSKEFVNTYTATGRKLPFGGREKSDVAISLKEVPAGTRSYPKKVGIDETGKGIYETEIAPVRAHNSLRVHSTCPDWVK